MQTRTITVDYTRPRGYDIGYRAENNFTLLALPIPAELEGADSYRVYFESTVGEYLQTELLTPADGYVTVKITSDVVPEPGNMAAQLVAFADGEIVGYAPMITGSAKVSIPDGTERLSHSLAAEIALNTAARHSHTNKSVLDKFAESDGKPTYDGEALGGGGSVDSVNGKTGAVVLTAEDINYDNDNTVYQLLSQYLKDFETVGNALTTLEKKSHTHSNKDTLDKLSDLNGKLQYNGSDVGLKGDKGDKGDPGSDANVTKANVITALGYTPEAVSAQVTTGSNITLADNTEYRLADVTTLTLNYPAGNFECWMRLIFAASGNVTVTLPTGTRYIGNAPSFANGETWEMSIKDGVVIAQKVGDGT